MRGHTSGKVRFRAFLAGSVSVLAVGAASAQNAGAPALVPTGPVAAQPTPAFPTFPAVPSVQPTAAASTLRGPPPPAGVTPPSAPALATPVEPTRTELPGVPFPSMMPQSGARPVPLSNQPLGLDSTRTQESMEQIRRQTNERLGNIREGLGMTPPNLTERMTELQELNELQRRTRMHMARRQEAEAAMAVYGLLFDARREEDAARREREDRDKEREDRTRAPVALGAAGTPNQPGAPNQQQVIEAATRMELPLPRIVTVSGGRENLRAVLLVPYVGEVSVGPGTVLPGDRRVISVTSGGVTVRDPRLGLVALGFGDSVPAAPPMIQNRPGTPPFGGPPPSFSPAGPPAFPLPSPTSPPVPR